MYSFIVVIIALNISLDSQNRISQGCFRATKYILNKICDVWVKQRIYVWFGVWCLTSSNIIFVVVKFIILLPVQHYLVR
jgi:hypothetical protein